MSRPAGNDGTYLAQNIAEGANEHSLSNSHAAINHFHPNSHKLLPHT